MIRVAALVVRVAVRAFYPSLHCFMNHRVKVRKEVQGSTDIFPQLGTFRYRKWKLGAMSAG